MKNPLSNIITTPIPGPVLPVVSTPDCSCDTNSSGNGGNLGSNTFISLLDTPQSYLGQAGKIVLVNGLENGLIFSNIPAPPTLIFNNGLTNTSDTIQLGGTLITDTVLSALNKNFSITSERHVGYNTNTFLKFQDNGDQLLIGYNEDSTSSVLTNQISFGPAGGIVLTAQANGAAYYAGDYEANFLPRTLITKQYVDGLIPTFTNGLTNTSGVVKLGGVLSQNTTIRSTDPILIIGDDQDAKALLQVYPGGNICSMITENGTYTNRLELGATTALMALSAGGGTKSIGIIPTAMTVTDSISNIGLINAGDYEDNFVPRSLITKQYGDGLISSLLSSNNTFTGVNSFTNNFSLTGLNIGIGSTGSTATFSGDTNNFNNGLNSSGNIGINSGHYLMTLSPDGIKNNRIQTNNDGAFTLYANTGGAGSFSFNTLTGGIKDIDGISFLKTNDISNIYRRLGTIYNNILTTSSSSLYTVAGTDTTWSFGSTGLTISGGIGTTTNRLTYTSYYTNASHYERKITFNSVINGSGIGIGLHSPTAGAEVIGRIDTSTGTLYIDVYRTGTVTNKATSTSTLTINTNDNITLSFIRNNGNYLLTAVNNTTGNKLIVSFTDPYTYLQISLAWSAANSAIYSYGGTQLVTNDTYIVNNIIQKDIVFYGNSIGSGNYSGANENAAANIISRGVIGGVNLIAGGSNKTSDGVNLLPEFLSLKPKMLIYTDGINDIINGVSLATTQANVLTIVNSCIANDIIPVICGILPLSSTYGGASNATYQAAIIAYNTWASGLAFVRYVDTFNSILDSSTNAMNTLYDAGDGIHLNQYGQEVLSTAIIIGVRNTISIGAALHYTNNGYKSNFSVGAFGGLVVQNSSTSASSSSGIRVLGNDNSTTAIVDVTSNTATGAGGLVTAAGITRFSTTGLNTYFGTQNTGASGAFIFSGGLGNSNVHAGFLNSGGYNWFDRINRFGDSTTPVATIDIIAGTTTVAPLKFNTGSLLTTPIAGTEEFSADRRYFTQTTGTTRQTYAWLSDIPSTASFAPIASPAFTGAIGFSNPSGNTIMTLDAVTGSISSIRLRTGTTGSISDYSINSGTGSANGLRIVNNKTGNTVLTADVNDRVGIGVTPAFAKLEILSTTEQIRNAYDASNYLSITTASTGITTFNPVGTAKGLSFTLGSDATGDIFYRNSTGLFTRLGIGSTGNVLIVSGGLPSWAASTALNRSHTIFIPTTGGTVTTINNQENIINPAGTLATLTVALPASPANNDTVWVTFTQAITTISYSGGTVVGGPTSATLGGQWHLTYDSGTTTWY